MRNKKDMNNAALYYSINMLKNLLKMKLITKDEYDRIVRISSEYYDTEIYCVWIDKSPHFRWTVTIIYGIVGVAKSKQK